MPCLQWYAFTAVSSMVLGSHVYNTDSVPQTACFSSSLSLIRNATTYFYLTDKKTSTEKFWEIPTGSMGARAETLLKGERERQENRKIWLSICIAATDLGHICMRFSVWYCQDKRCETFLHYMASFVT